MAYFEYLVGVGSNLDDRHGWIEQAIALLQDAGVEILKRSTLIESAPVGAADRPFINGAIVCRSRLSPTEFMGLLLATEQKLGRIREVRWGNRNIDLDLLLAKDEHGQEIVLSTQLVTIPHPRMWERDFVMKPASEIWSFSSEDSGWVWWCFLGMVFRWILAACIPFGNDEAYYWDWGRAPQLSYYDHPPMVSWLSWAGQQLWPFDRPTLAGRLLVPLCHFAATLLLFQITERLNRRPLNKMQCIAFVVATQLVPAFSLGGIMLMPDIGLILFSTLAICLVLKWYGNPKLTVFQGIAVGVSFGLAGASKYHAVVIAAGALGYLLWRRRRQWIADIGFWFFLVLAGLVVVSPVFIWNADHQWVSFLFQSSRGLAGHGIELVPALRTLLGEILFLGPILFGFVVFFKRIKCGRDETLQFLLWAAVPLLLILKIFSFTSQTLPHWTMPSFWLLAPLAILGLADSPVVGRWVKFYGLILCLVVPLILSSPELRGFIISLTHNRPGGLGELTLWDNAKLDREFVTYVFDERWIDRERRKKCHGDMIFAGARWYTVAQAAANLPGHPIVETLDPDKISYYNFRTPAESWIGCPTVLLSEEAHFDGVLEGKHFESIEHRRFVIQGHEDRAIIVARGIHR